MTLTCVSKLSSTKVSEKTLINQDKSTNCEVDIPGLAFNNALVLNITDLNYFYRF